MIATRFTRLLGIDHPVVLAGMAGATSPELVAAVSNAGGLGILGATGTDADAFRELGSSLRRLTHRPFGINLLLHAYAEGEIRGALDAAPAVLSTSWPREDQDLRSIFAAAHERGVTVVHMVPTVADAERAAEAGADVIVAQGTDGGGHIGLIGTSVIVPMVTRAVAPLPVLAAGGVADGRGLAAMLALGADGALLGTRFLATPEAPLHDVFKRRIVESDGEDTIVTDLADVMLGNDWPGALARIARNRVVERWLGRDNELRRHRERAIERMLEARSQGDPEEAVLYWGQCAGLIEAIAPAADVVATLVAEAEAVISKRLAGMIVAAGDPPAAGGR